MQWISEVAASGSVWWLTAIFAATALLFVWARRGWRRGDVTVCRRCDFDVRGLPEGGQCPECGADLSKPKATATGARRPVLWLSVLAGAAAALAGAWAAAALIVQTTGLRGVDLMTTSALIADLTKGDARARQAAWTELLRRRGSGDLTPQDKADWFGALDDCIALGPPPTVAAIDGLAVELHGELPADADASLVPYWTALVESVESETRGERYIAAVMLCDWYDRGSVAGGELEMPARMLLPLVDPLLDLQGDPGADWHAFYGDLLMILHMEGQLSPEALRRYVEQGFTVEMSPRTALSIGEDWAFDLRYGRRLHSHSSRRPGNPDWRVGFRTIDLYLNDIDVRQRREQGYPGRKIADGHWNYSVPLVTGWLGPFAGQTVPARADLGFVAYTPRGDEVASWTLEHAFDLNVRPGDAPSVALVADDADRDVMERAFTPREALEEGASGPQLRVSRADGAATLAIAIANPPHDFAFAVQVRDVESGKPVGVFEATPDVVRAGRRDSIVISGSMADDGEGRQMVDVVLVPDVAVAARSPGVVSVWGRPVVLRDVRVVYE